MAQVRSNFLAALKKGDTPAFVELVALKKVGPKERLSDAPKQGKSLEEFITTLPRKEYNFLVDSIHRKIVEPCVAEITAGRVDEADVQAVSSAAAFLRAFASDKDRNASRLAASVEFLVGNLGALEPRAPGVALEVGKLGEIWWSQERPGRETLATPLLDTLVRQALQSHTVSDVHRCVSMHEALESLDWTDPCSPRLRTSLLRAVIDPLFLTTTEGKKFLSLVLVHTPQFLTGAQKAIRVQISNAPKVFQPSETNSLIQAMLEAFGALYYKAWCAAPEAKQGDIESGIQDLVHNAVHVADRKIVSNIRHLLAYLHGKKRQRGVDAMLLRVYEPILWRSLKVANPLVRRNAAALLVDAFPLQDPDAPQRETDELLQQQFRQLDALLSDNSAPVRAVGVHGVCRVLGVYWELIPVAIAKSLLSRLVNDLVHDTAAAEVRSAVFEGLEFVLDNRLTQPVLRSLLPALQPMIHDTSERVRAAFLRLLLKVKECRTVKFYDVVPVEHLLVRLRIDSESIRNQITALLLNTYFPYEKPSKEQLRRAVFFLTDDTEAALEFYGRVFHTAPLQAVAKLILVCTKYVARCLDKQAADKVPAAKRPRKEEQAEEDDEGGSSPALLSKLLELAGALWRSISQRLQRHSVLQVGSHPLLLCQQESLQAGLGDAQLSTFLKRLPEAEASVIALAACLPEAALPQLSEAVLPRVRELTPEAPESEWKPLLNTLMRWLYHDQLVGLLVEWLLQPFVEKRQKPRVEQAGLALNLLTYLLSQDDLRPGVLTSEHLAALKKVLFNYIPLAQSQVQKGPPSDLVVAGVGAYCCLLVHCQEAGALAEVVQWLREYCLTAPQTPLPLLDTVLSVAAEVIPLPQAAKVVPELLGFIETVITGNFPPVLFAELSGVFNRVLFALAWLGLREPAYAELAVQLFAGCLSELEPELLNLLALPDLASVLKQSDRLLPAMQQWLEPLLQELPTAPSSGLAPVSDRGRAFLKAVAGSSPASATAVQVLLHVAKEGGQAGAFRALCAAEALSQANPSRPNLGKEVNQILAARLEPDDPLRPLIAV